MKIKILRVIVDGIIEEIRDGTSGEISEEIPPEQNFGGISAEIPGGIPEKNLEKAKMYFADEYLMEFLEECKKKT